MTEEEKDNQDWENFFITLREQSVRFFLIDRPYFLGTRKFTQYHKEKLF
jgi:hypothetical protein